MDMFGLAEAVGRAFKFCDVYITVRHDSIVISIRREFIKTGAVAFDHCIALEQLSTMLDPIPSIVGVLLDKTEDIFDAIESVEFEEL